MSIKKKASGRWEVRWYEGNKRPARTFDRKADAERFDLELRRKLQLGGVGVFEDVTLAEYVEEWWRLHVVPNLSANTRKNYTYVWNKHCLPRLGGHKLRNITPSVITRFCAELKRAGAGEPTIIKALTVLQSILTLAVTEERIDSNPVTKIKKPNQAMARKVEPYPPLTVEQLRDLVGERDATLISLLAYAGVRPGEALALTWADIGAKSIRIERAVALGEKKKTKTYSQRTIKLMHPLAQDLTEWQLASGTRQGTIFPRQDGEPWQDYDWRNWRKRTWRPVATKLGLVDSRPYDLRHSFVSLLIQEGQTVVEVARQAGHSAETCLRYYAHVFADYDPENRISAEEQIRQARAELTLAKENASPKLKLQAHSKVERS